MKYKILLLFACFVSFAAFGQVLQNKKEIEIDGMKSYLDALPMGRQGVLLFKDTEKSEKTGNIWDFTLYNTELESSWQFQATIPKGLTIDDKYFDGQSQTGYLLFKSTSKATLLIINPSQKKTETKAFKLPDKFGVNVSGFSVAGNIAYLVGTSGKKNVVFCFNMTTNQPSELLNDKENYNSFSTIRNSSEILDVTAVSENSREGTVAIHSFEKGRKLNSLQILPDGEKKFMDTRITSTDKGQVVVGTYKKYDYADGIYFASYENGKKVSTKYHSFTDVKKFHTYLPVSTYGGSAEKKRNKLKEKQAEGKDAKFDYKVYLHNIIQREKDFIIIGEVYVPYYYTTTYGKGTQKVVYETFAGWMYTHAFIVCLDAEGNKIWDDTFVLSGLFPYHRFLLQSRMENGVIKMISGFSNYISSKTIVGDRVISESNIDFIAREDENDKVRTTVTNFNTSDLPTFSSSYWYDKFFIIWGKQFIKNKKSKENRSIFYLDKILY
jgi:hypothetical protein